MPPAEVRDVDINYAGQKFKGCNGLLLVAKDAEETKIEMSKLVETTQDMKQEITEVNLCVQRIDGHLKKNGNSNGNSNGNGRSLKRDVAVFGGAGLGVGAIVYAEQIINLFKAIFGG